MQILTTEEQVLLTRTTAHTVPADLETDNHSANPAQIFEFKPILTAEKAFLLSKTAPKS